MPCRSKQLLKILLYYLHDEFAACELVNEPKVTVSHLHMSWTILVSRHKTKAHYTNASRHGNRRWPRLQSHCNSRLEQSDVITSPSLPPSKDDWRHYSSTADIHVSD